MLRAASGETAGSVGRFAAAKTSMPRGGAVAVCSGLAVTVPSGLVPDEPVPGVLTADGPSPDGLPTARKPAGPKLAGLAGPELRSCGARLAWRTRTGSPTSVTSAGVTRAIAVAQRRAKHCSLGYAAVARLGRADDARLGRAERCSAGASRSCSAPEYRSHSGCALRWPSGPAGSGLAASKALGSGISNALGAKAPLAPRTGRPELADPKALGSAPSGGGWLDESWQSSGCRWPGLFRHNPGRRPRRYVRRRCGRSLLPARAVRPAGLTVWWRSMAAGWPLAAPGRARKSRPQRPARWE